MGNCDKPNFTEIDARKWIKFLPRNWLESEITEKQRKPDSDMKYYRESISRTTIIGILIPKCASREGIVEDSVGVIVQITENVMLFA